MRGSTPVCERETHPGAPRAQPPAMRIPLADLLRAPDNSVSGPGQQTHSIADVCVEQIDLARGPGQACETAARTWSSISFSPLLTCAAPNPTKPPSLAALAAACAEATSHWPNAAVSSGVA